MKITLAAIALCIATPALAENRCFPRADFVALMEKEYQELPTIGGYDGEHGVIMEILASEAGTWTLIMTKANGLACVISVGEGFAIAEAKGQL